MSWRWLVNWVYKNFCRVFKKWLHQKCLEIRKGDYEKRKRGRRRVERGEGSMCKCDLSINIIFFQDRNFLFSQAIRVKCKPGGVTARSCFFLRNKGAGRGELRKAELLCAEPNFTCVCVCVWILTTMFLLTPSTRCLWCVCYAAE